MEDAGMVIVAEDGTEVALEAIAAMVGAPLEVVMEASDGVLEALATDVAAAMVHEGNAG